MCTTFVYRIVISIYSANENINNLAYKQYIKQYNGNLKHIDKNTGTREMDGGQLHNIDEGSM